MDILQFRCAGCGDVLRAKNNQEKVTCRKCGKTTFRKDIGTDRKNRGNIKKNNSDGKTGRNP